MAEEILSAKTTAEPTTAPVEEVKANPEVVKDTTKEELKTYETEAKKAQSGVNESADIDKKSDKEKSDAEFTDTTDEEGKETASKKEEKVAQTKEQNSEFAKRRREAEKEKTRVSTIIEVLNGKNPYTNEEMTDKADVDEYLAMKEIEKQGGDPLKDYFKFQKTKRREEETTQKTEEARKEWFRKDKENFIAKYPDVNLTELVDDKYFAKFAKGKVGNLPMSEIYEDYQEFIGKSDEKATTKAAQLLANSKATPGSLKTANPSVDDGYFTREQVEKMSQKEVSKNYEAIRKSMATWKN